MSARAIKPKAVSPKQDEDVPAGGSCPICGKPSMLAYRPFCSRRCSDVDLNRWLTGAYVIPGKAEESEDDKPGAPQPRAKEDGPD